MRGKYFGCTQSRRTGCLIGSVSMESLLLLGPYHDDNNNNLIDPGYIIIIINFLAQNKISLKKIIHEYIQQQQNNTRLTWGVLIARAFHYIAKIKWIVCECVCVEAKGQHNFVQNWNFKNFNHFDLASHNKTKNHQKQ